MLSLLANTFQALNCLNGAGSVADWFFQVKKNSGYNAVYLDNKTRASFANVDVMTSMSNPVMRTLK